VGIIRIWDINKELSIQDIPTASETPVTALVFLIDSLSLSRSLSFSLFFLIQWWLRKGMIVIVYISK
jgi:hypothetical protein